MIYRPIGKTGMSASVIGLGGEYLDHRPYETSEEVVGAALEHGINIIDVFMPGTPVRENIAKALKGKRDKVLIQGHIGSVDRDGQYHRTREVKECNAYFEDLLRCFGGYIDLGMMFFIDTEEDYRESFEAEFLSYVRQLKQDGKIRAIGASCHDPEMGARIVETGIVDVIMFSVNIAYDMLPSDVYIIDVMEELDASRFRGIEPKRARFYELCENRGVAITTMKTLGAGKLISPEFSPFSEPLSVGQCIHYALSRPAVVSTLIGCKTRGEVEEAVRYLDMTDEERDYSRAIKGFKGDWSAKCMYCNHCLPCPSEIDIAAVTRMLDVASLDESNISAELKGRYGKLAYMASECIECGACEERCPFGVKVIENMRNAARLFE
jgi:hypothetical protein